MPPAKKPIWVLPPTLEEFYKNPSGKGITSNNVSSVRYVMDARYDILTKKLKKKMPVTVFEESERSYYFWIVIPSDMRDYNYDVVIHLYSIEEDPSSSLRKWNVQFFSNCPSFVFTYAYAYNANGLFIPFLAKKLGRATTELPSEKNPDLQVEWDKSIYYAMKVLMTNLRYTQRFVVKRMAEPFSEKELASRLRSFDEVMKDLQTKKKSKAFVRKEFQDARESHIAENIKKQVSKRVKGIIEKGIEKKQQLTKHNYSSSGKVIAKNSHGKITGKHKISGKNKRR